MSENKRLNNYDELPLVLDVADIQRLMNWFIHPVFRHFEAAD